MVTFNKLLQAIDIEEEPVFPEETAILGASHVELVARTAAQAGHQGSADTSTAVTTPPEAAVRSVTCRTCGRTFTTPVRRGRPPSQCPSCQESRR